LKRAHIIVEGYVQRVGFRAFIQDVADELGLSGWVRNLSNGDVEIMVEGPTESIEKLLSLCRKGPPRSRVFDLKISMSPSTGEFKGFSR
jgi:acylphosphatase